MLPNLPIEVRSREVVCEGCGRRTIVGATHILHLPDHERVLCDAICVPLVMGAGGGTAVKQWMKDSSRNTK